MMMQDWMMPYGSAQWLMFVVVVALVAYPVGKILSRIGFSPLWAILAFLPIVNLLGLWIVALAEWPKRTSGDVK